MEPEAFGNDYAIDDISLNEISVDAYTPQKSVSSSYVNVGDTVTYTVTMQNTGTNPLTDVMFQDLIPNGLSFVPGSAVINGTGNPNVNPNTGFAVPDVAGNSVLTVSFSAIADSIPEINPPINSAKVTYSYSPVKGGIPNTFSKVSNNVPVTVTVPAPASADISVIKKANTGHIGSGEMITYTVNVRNNGPVRPVLKSGRR